MNCNRLAGCLNAYMDREVPDADRAALDRHIEDCPDCQLLLSREEHLRQAVRELPIERPRPDLFASAMARARQTEQPTRLAQWKVAASAALAASVASWFVAGQLHQVAAPQSPSPVATVTMAMHETRTIHLVFDSPSAMKSARLSVRLPEGIELADYPDRRNFRWRTDLRAGKNVLPLDLVVRNGAGGELLARLSHSDRFKIFRVRVNVSTRSGHA